MIDLDRTMFFKARFEIETPQGEDVLWSLVLSVRDWSLRKARRDGYSLPQEMRLWTKLKSGEMLERRILPAPGNAPLDQAQKR